MNRRWRYFCKFLLFTHVILNYYVQSIFARIVSIPFTFVIAGTLTRNVGMPGPVTCDAVRKNLKKAHGTKSS